MANTALHIFSTYWQNTMGYVKHGDISIFCRISQMQIQPNFIGLKMKPLAAEILCRSKAMTTYRT